MLNNAIIHTITPNIAKHPQILSSLSVSFEKIAGAKKKAKNPNPTKQYITRKKSCVLEWSVSARCPLISKNRLTIDNNVLTIVIF